jgi:hypothetical protein
MDGAGLLFTGIHWNGDRPALEGLTGARERARPLERGLALGWEVAGPRRCVGFHDRRAGRRRPCPVGALRPEGGQCDVCERADPSRLVARGQAPRGYEDVPYVLYLAWFGDGLHKVGISAERRGAGRLCEQGALSYCLVAGGPFNAVRRAELLLAGLGVAPERLAPRRKQAAWWRVPQASERAAELAALHTAAVAAVRAEPGVAARPFAAVDLTPAYGLDRDEVPGAYDVITAVAPGSVLAGVVTHVVGEALVLGPSAVVVESRVLEGWTLRRSDRPRGGLGVEARSREADARAVQGRLF